MELRQATRTIELSGPDVTEEEIAAVTAVLRGPRLSLGPKAPEFERAVADYVGCRYAVAVNSGTSALHLIVRAVGLGDGDEVITTPFSFVASANCLLYERAAPRFVDIDPVTLNLDCGRVEAAITPRTRAILAVDVFGRPADWEALRRLAAAHDLALIEDSCEALGAGGQAVGDGGESGGRGLLRLLPEQADHHRGGWDDRDGSGGRGAALPEHEEPGAGRRRGLAVPCAARV